MRKSIVAGLLTTAALTGSLFAPSIAQATPRADAQSSVYVVHGLPLDNAGTKVDVYAGAAGGETGAAGLVADDLTYRSVAGPLKLDPASYTVYVAKPTASDDGKLTSDEVLFSKTLDVPAGQNLSAVASFDAAGSPTINVFSNDVAATPDNGGRISIRHAANAPDVRVDLGYLPYSRQFRFFVQQYGPAKNGQQADITTLAGAYDVVVRVAEGGTRVTAIPRFGVKAGTLTAVYVVGKPGSTLGFVVQRIAL